VRLFRRPGLPANVEEGKNGYRVDLLINGLVVVELKSIERIAEVHLKQVLT
jgi:GxxExxY protein